MGIAIWLIAGAVAALVVRLIPYGRPAGRLLEAAVALSSAFGAGVAATALDFGGWNEPDPRAALFAFVSALAVTGIVRLMRMV